jgi:hypothetical protein
MVEVPHMLAVFGGAAGGTKYWGRGVSVFVGETRPRLGDVSLQRLWLGEKFGPQYEIQPARGWVLRSDKYLDIPPLGGAGAAAAAAAAAEGGSEGSADATDAPSESEQEQERQRLEQEQEGDPQQPQHGGGGGIAPFQEAQAAAEAAEVEGANMAAADAAKREFAAAAGGCTS